MKKVLPVKDIRVLFDAGRECKQPEQLYEYFTRALDRALSETAGTLDPELEEDDLARLALDLALRSYADQLACVRLLEILKQRGQQAGK